MCFHEHSNTGNATRSVSSSDLLTLIVNGPILVFEIIAKFGICTTKIMFAPKMCFHGLSSTGNATRSVSSRDLLTLIVNGPILVFEIIPKFGIWTTQTMFGTKTCFHGFSSTGNVTRSVLSRDLLTLINNGPILVFDIIPKFRICQKKPIFAVKTCIHRFSSTGNATR